MLKYMHSNHSNLVRMVGICIVQICIQILRIWLEWLEFAFESCLKCSNLHSNASNLVGMVRIPIGMLRIPFQ